MSDCWFWGGIYFWNGYGQVYSPAHKEQIRAHRLMYEMVVGPIPKGLELDHLCRRRSCVNPDHLRAVTHRENLLAPGSKSPSAIHAAQTECFRGHAFSKENTSIRRNGSRRCKACHRLDELARRNSARGIVPSHSAACPSGTDGAATSGLGPSASSHSGTPATGTLYVLEGQVDAQQYDHHTDLGT